MASAAALVLSARTCASCGCLRSCFFCSGRSSDRCFWGFAIPGSAVFASRLFLAGSPALLVAQPILAARFCSRNAGLVLYQKSVGGLGEFLTRKSIMANVLYQQIEMLIREKHIEPAIVVSAIEDAMVVAARKYYKTEEDLRGKFNAETGQVDVFSVLTVVEEVTDPTREVSLADARKKNPASEVGTEILTNKPTDVLGRIAAQTAKQVILQKVREAERDTIFNEYHSPVG